MQPFAKDVKPLVEGATCAELGENFESGLETRILQALAVHDYRQAVLAIVAHPGALLLPEFVYDRLSAVGHSTVPLDDLEIAAVELAAVVVLRIAEISRNTPKNPDNSAASVLQGRAT